MPSSSRGRRIGRGGYWGERAREEVPVKCRCKIAVLTQGYRVSK